MTALAKLSCIRMGPVVIPFQKVQQQASFQSGPELACVASEDATELWLHRFRISKYSGQHYRDPTKYPSPHCQGTVEAMRSGFTSHENDDSARPGLRCFAESRPPQEDSRGYGGLILHVLPAQDQLFVLCQASHAALRIWMTRVPFDILPVRDRPFSLFRQVLYPSFRIWMTRVALHLLSTRDRPLLFL